MKMVRSEKPIPPSGRRWPGLVPWEETRERGALATEEQPESKDRGKASPVLTLSKGLRVLGLTHALRTFLADGAYFSTRKAGQLGGLTDVGACFLEEAEKLGIVVDVSHLNDPSFWDVIKFARAPVIASHSNCRTLCDHLRNLTDDQIKAVADGGGVVGVNACSVFVDPPDFEHLVDHLEHIVKVGGVEHAGLGPDFADYLLIHMTEVEKASLPLDGVMPVQGLPGDEAFSRFAEELARRGYKPAEIDLIMGENFARVFKSVLKP